MRVVEITFCILFALVNLILSFWAIEDLRNPEPEDATGAASVVFMFTLPQLVYFIIRVVSLFK